MADNTNECDSTSPTDWPDALPQLRTLDTLFRCPICFEYINTAMILPQCSHNYCSLCIRKYITYKTQCPTCTQNVAAPELKNNRLLDDVIRNFVQVRSKLLSLVRTTSLDENHRTRTEHVVETTGNSKKSPRTTPERRHPPVTSKSPPVVTADKKPADPAEVDTDVEEDDGAYSDDDMFEPSPACDTGLNTSTSACVKAPSTSPPVNTDCGPCRSQLIAGTSATSVPTTALSVADKVPCPVCNVQIPERNINLHLDRCLKNDSKSDVINVEDVVRRKPLTKFVYQLMTDKELKKRLGSCNLPTNGDRQTLIKRHQAYTILYNSQCDALNPKPVFDIVSEVMQNEKNTNKLLFSPKQRLNVNKGDKNEDITTAQKQYAMNHKSQFSQLIADTRKRQKLSKQASATSTARDRRGADFYDDDYDDPLCNSGAPPSGQLNDDRPTTQFDDNDAGSEASACSSRLLSGDISARQQQGDLATRSTDDDEQCGQSSVSTDDSFVGFPPCSSADSTSMDSAMRRLDADSGDSQHSLDHAMSDNSDDATVECNKESEPVLNQENEPILDQENESVVNQESEPVINQENEPVLLVENGPVLDQDNEPILNQEHEPILTQENISDLNQDSEPVLDYGQSEGTLDTVIPDLNEDDTTERHTSPDIKRKRATRGSEPSSKRSRVMDAVPRRTLRARK